MVNTHQQNSRRLLLLGLLFCFLFNLSSAQTELGLKSPHFWFKNFWSLNSSAILGERGNIETQAGNAVLSSYHPWSFKMGAKYFLNFNEKISLTAGIYWGTLSLSWKFNLQPEQYPILEEYRFNEKGQVNLTAFYELPLTVEFRKILSPRFALHFDLGLNLKLYFNSEATMGYSIQDTSLILNVMEVELFVDEEDQFQFNYLTQVGLSYMLPNYKLINVGLTYNQALNNVAKGHYVFFPDDPDYRSTGTYKMRGSYLSIDISYVFTRNKRVKER